MTTIQEIHLSRIRSGIFHRLCDTQMQIALSGRDMNHAKSCINYRKLLKKFENTKPRGKAYTRMVNKHFRLWQ